MSPYKLPASHWLAGFCFLGAWAEMENGEGEVFDLPLLAHLYER